MVLYEKNIWSAKAPFSQLNLYYDWDYYASDFASLRTYLFDHQTAPIWNFMFCGGRPEMGNPENWSYTWLSLIGYLLPPNYALFAIWIIMLTLGILSSYLLFNSWFNNKFAALTGALLLCLNGYVSSHFNQGHMTFAFFFFIPPIFLFYDTLLTKKKLFYPSLGLIIISYLFISSALPHTLFYFYPAFLIFVIFRLIEIGLKKSWKQAFNATLHGLIYHSLGMMLAAYKIWPVVSWQLKMPREGVVNESYSLLDIFQNLITLNTTFDGTKPVYLSTTSWGIWEYNSFIGIVPILLLLLSVYFFFQSKKTNKPFPTNSFYYLLTLVVTGCSLSLGNDNFASLSYMFKYISLLNGIRVFARYQILIIFGISAIVVLTIGLTEEKISKKFINIFRMIIFSTILIPIIIQFSYSVSSIKVFTDKDIELMYKNKPLNKPNPVLGFQRYDISDGYTFQKFLIEKNVWVADCYEALNTHEIKFQNNFINLTEPPPQKIILGAKSIEFVFKNISVNRIKYNLLLPPEFKSSLIQEKNEGENIYFYTGKRNKNEVHLKIEAIIPEFSQGLIISALSLFIIILLFIFRKNQISSFS